MPYDIVDGLDGFDVVSKVTGKTYFNGDHAACEAFIDRAEKAGKARLRAKARQSRDNAMRGLGLVKVRGALGGVYWE